MNKFRKIFLLAAAVSMIFSLTACTEEEIETVSQITSIIIESSSALSVSEIEPEISETIFSSENEMEISESVEVSISEEKPEISDSAEVSVSEEPEIEPEYVDFYFRNKKLLDQHYEKHGKDMGFSDSKAYEKAASDVINNPDALTKTEKEDGDYIFYIEETNEFVVLSVDGYIRTYFLPDSGKKYYDKQ